MSIVEVKHSLFSNAAIQGLMECYKIGAVERCEFLIRGLNDTYVVFTEKEKYIFRVYRKNWRELSDILYEIDALNFLAEVGVPVSVPVKRVDGSSVVEIDAPEGLRYGVLFTFSKGDRPEITVENCGLIGQALGKLHKVSTSFASTHKRSFDIDLNHLADDPLELILPKVHHFLGDSNASFVSGMVKTVKGEIAAKTLDFGFCHGDFHNFNMHLVDQKIEAFDFDCCSRGYRSHDLAVFGWNLKNNYPAMEAAGWDAFLNGYFGQNGLSDDNLKVVPKFVALRRIWFLGVLLKNDDVWGTHWINGKNLGTFISQLEQDVEKF